MTGSLGSFVATICLLAAPAATPSIAQTDSRPASTVAGTWTMAIKGQGAHGDTSAELALEQAGKKVTGKLRAHGGEHPLEGDFVDGTLTLATTTGDSSQQLSVTGKLKDDGTLDGYLSGPMGDLRWTASRAKNSK